MGFGKFLLGGVCAVGAVIAAPIVVPAAGMAIAASSVTGAIGLTAGLGLVTASSATVATVAGVTAGVAGVAAGAYQEKQVDDARYEGQHSGYNKASKEYTSKFQKQVAEFTEEKKNLKQNIDEYKELIEDMLSYIEELKYKHTEEPNNSVIANELNNVIDELDTLKMLRTVC